MGGQDLKDEFRHLEEQMGIHLLMVCMASVLSAVLICFTFMMSWELWTIPLIMAGILTVWCFHIGRFISEQTYEYLCAGFMIIECFYFGVHQESFTSLPVLICLLFLVLILLEKKFLIYMVEAVTAAAHCKRSCNTMGFCKVWDWASGHCGSYDIFSFYHRQAQRGTGRGAGIG